MVNSGVRVGQLFPLMVKRLKDSLGTAFVLYQPLAGRLAYVAEIGDIILDWTEQVGVAFVESSPDTWAWSVLPETRCRTFRYCWDWYRRWTHGGRRRTGKEGLAPSPDWV
ncbi:hypothetical protein PR202_gb25661 [Eleusine coracana subsp. coracana]|uniref:Uncharacterized protein n=1 Tax=Eleusine coracana subsp. coracana TaxID=191504 RepID=A0AAV5FR68_ELECO|nr:hypothetical protein PR202_gb25661 [Eleusine coracana subsp. coracana]